MRPTQDRLREVLDYDPNTGVFTWRVNVGGRSGGAASTAGTVNKHHGYRIICVDTEDCRAHCLAWLYVYGVWPVAEIDHADEDRSNNRINNLREASKSQNGQNRSKPRSDNRSGYRGVCFDKSRNRWKATINTGGRQHFIGRYRTAEQAHEAYLAAKRVLHPFWAGK